MQGAGDLRSRGWNVGNPGPLLIRPIVEPGVVVELEVVASDNERRRAVDRYHAVLAPDTYDMLIN